MVNETKEDSHLTVKLQKCVKILYFFNIIFLQHVKFKSLKMQKYKQWLEMCNEKWSMHTVWIYIL